MQEHNEIEQTWNSYSDEHFEMCIRDRFWKPIAWAVKYMGRRPCGSGLNLSLIHI